jgi:LPS-assembly lipoprotein
MLLFKRFLVLAIAVSIAGCGFQLRGSKSVPPEMQRTYIDTLDRHSVFYRKMRSELLIYGVDVVDSAADATAVFSITSDVTDQRVVSVSARNVPREFEIFYTVRYQLNTPDKTLVEDSTQTMTRDYVYDETLVLGKDNEQQVLRDAIADDLVRLVMIQLTSL